MNNTCQKIESLLETYKRTNDVQIKSEIIKLNIPRLKIIVEKESDKEGIPYDELYEVALNALNRLIEEYDYYNSKKNFTKTFHPYMHRELSRYSRNMLLKQGIIKNTFEIQRKNHKIITQTNELLKKYRETKSTKIKKQIIQILSEKVKELAKKLNYEDIPLETAYEIALEVLDSTIEEYIELNNFNIVFDVLYETKLRDKLQSISKKHIDSKKLKKLLEMYDIYRSETLKEEIVQTYIKRVYAILDKYKDTCVPYEELLNVALIALRMAIEKFFESTTVDFRKYATKTIIYNLDKYIALKSNEYVSSLESEKILKI